MTNGAFAERGEATAARILSESASLPEYFAARRRLIDNITEAIHHADQLVGDPLRDAFFAIALEDSATLASLEEQFDERNPL